jgi:hypothetical protein
MTFKEFLKRIADKWFCLHEWKLKESVSLWNKSLVYTKIPDGYIRFYCCTKCGKTKKVNL